MTVRGILGSSSGSSYFERIELAALEREPRRLWRLEPRELALRFSSELSKELVSKVSALSKCLSEHHPIQARSSSRTGSSLALSIISSLLD